MKKIIKNNSGAALAWVMITFFCAAIFILAGQSIVLRYFNTANTEKQKNQAYLTARSVCDALANSIISEEIMIIDAINNLENQGDFFEFDNIQLDLPIEEMGETKAKIVKDRSNDKSYTIVVSTTLGNYTETVSLKMLRELTTEGAVSSGLVGTYHMNSVFNNISSVSYSSNTNAYLYGNVNLGTVNQINSHKNIYCYPNTRFSASNKKINVYGDIYIMSAQNINNNTLDIIDSENPANNATFTESIRVGDHPKIKHLPNILPYLPPVWSKTDGIPYADKHTVLEPLKTYVISNNVDVSFQLSSAINDSSATGEQPIFFIIDNSEVYLHKAIESSNGHPKAWFILLGNSKLEVQDDSYLGIYASADSTVNFINKDRDFNIYGEFVLSKITASTNNTNVTFNYSGYVGPGNTESVERWRKRSYEAGVW